jgi:hypothetical protein
MPEFSINQRLHVFVELAGGVQLLYDPAQRPL